MVESGIAMLTNEVVSVRGTFFRIKRINWFKYDEFSTTLTINSGGQTNQFHATAEDWKRFKLAVRGMKWDLENLPQEGPGAA